MRNGIFKKFASVLMAAGIMTGSALTAFADGDVTLDCSDAIESENWTQSVKFGYNREDPNGAKNFDATRMTPDSVIKVTYDIVEDHFDETTATGYPVELIFQSWSYPDSPLAGSDGGLWAKVAPATVDAASNTEEFAYADIVAAYGSDNFEKVDCVLFGSTNDAKILVTGVTITNCKDEGNHWVDPSIAQAAEEAEKKEKANTKKNIIGIVVGIAAGVIVAVGVLWFIISSKSREAFDVTTGEFVDKKDAK